MPPVSEEPLGALLLTAGSAFGGLGLFLLAVRMLTDGLKVAAGGALREVLGNWTSTPLRGVWAGMGMTALVQSSSAVTVATIGFVNAGLLTLFQALGVIYGANVGTTMTGWLVAAVGFEFKLELFALPLIGIGMALRLAGGDTRRGALGEALAGFGLFFIGIGVLKEAFDGLAARFDIAAVPAGGFGGMLLYVGLGFLMTLVTQSSSAAIAITLTAATGGVLQLDGAAAMVIGANVGTTSTAGLAVIGATPNAKRVAAAHLVFNLVTAMVALALMPLMLWLVAATGHVLGLADAPAVSLALFHTVFNVLGVVIMFPLSLRLSNWLCSRFRTEEEAASRPQHLDPNVLVTPVLALNALVLETLRIGQHARGTAQAVLSAEQQAPLSVQREQRVVSELGNAVGEFVTQLQRTALPAEVAEQLPIVLRTVQYYLEIVDSALEYANERGAYGVVLPDELAGRVAALSGEAARVLAEADPHQEGFTAQRCLADAETVVSDYRRVKEALLAESARARFKVVQLADLLEQLRRVRRIAQQAAKASQYLDVLLDAVQNPEQMLASKASRVAAAQAEGSEPRAVDEQRAAAAAPDGRSEG
jgi:phosphate:Na+ symporter